MFKKTKLCMSLSLACGGVLLSAGGSAVAQTTPAPSQQLERVEITGSNIRRTDAETASPVQVITKQDIDQSGKGTVAEYLQTLTADGQGSVPFTYGRGFSGATSSGISLRGLGANATLVLINGRRVNSAVLADDAQRSYTDLNQIPLEAVERIEVLKDGASSIYGSDAVAGVVNIILRRNFVGTVAKLTYGISEEGDGNEPRAAFTHGFGDMAKDGFNVLLNVELGRKSPIYYRDRTNRNGVGVSAIGQPEWGFDPNAGPGNNIGRYGGQGTIPVSSLPSGRVNNSSNASFIGNVRNPTTLDYYSRSDPTGVGFTRLFPGAGVYCLANTNLPQNNAAGGCITDQRQQVNQVQPKQETGSFFGRFSKQINPEMEAFVELGYYGAKTKVTGLGIAPSAAYFPPNGLVVSQTAVTQLGAAHPDNPYFGRAARLSYNPQFDTEGLSGTESKSSTARFLAGIKGTAFSWDYDTGVFASGSNQRDTSQNVINWRVKNALLNPTAANVAAATAFSAQYAALPAGTFWRIGENAGLNSAELYDALRDDKSRKGESRFYGIDFKASRQLGQLDGGPIGVAVGAEFRRETVDLNQWNGQGDFQGLSLTSYSGGRNIAAVYTEVLLPVFKQLELSAALRYDRYSDAGSSLTPKVGAKYTPFSNLAIRGTYARGFRAPSIPEQTAIAGFGGIVVDDNVRCAALAGLPQATINANCLGIAPTFVIAGNPDLDPEKSKSATLGIVWDITPKTSFTADVWQIKRSGLIINQDGQSAVDAGNVTRDPATALTPNDPGAILAGAVLYTNANDSLTRGIDVEFKHRFDLDGGMGRVLTGVTWTHLFVQNVTDATGLKHKYAGTHGNCDITNCIGSPRDRVSIAATWDMGQYRVGANVNYRGQMANTFEQSDTTCAQTTANGADFPKNCRVKHFTTMDLSGGWKINKNLEIFGSIQNLFDSKPPVDFETYGAIGYNPLDYSGAIGRFYRLGLKYQF